MVLSRVCSRYLAPKIHVRSLDFTLLSASWPPNPSTIDWRSDDTVQNHIQFLQAASGSASESDSIYPDLRSLRINFVRERLCQTVWDTLVEAIHPFKNLTTLCISHLRSPSESPVGNVGFADELLRVSTELRIRNGLCFPPRCYIYFSLPRY